MYSRIVDPLSSCVAYGLLLGYAFERRKNVYSSSIPQESLVQKVSALIFSFEVTIWFVG